MANILPYTHLNPSIAEHVYLQPSCQIIGDVTIGMHSSVWCNAVLRGDVNHIIIGQSSNIQDFSMCHVSHKSTNKPLGSPLIIGDFVTIGHSVILHGCQIGNRCLIGMGSIVMDDVIIEDDVMLAAGSLVSPNKRLESGFLYVGRPAVKARPLTEDERKFLTYSAEHYVRVKNNYMHNTPNTPT